MSKLHPDDMNVGDYITVTRCLYSDDRSYKGDVLRVELVELPFILVHADEIRMSGIKLDVREWDFMRLSKEYVDMRRNFVSRWLGRLFSPTPAAAEGRKEGE